MNLDDFADPMLADAANELLARLEQFDVVSAGMQPGPDGTVIFTEVDLGEVSFMDLDGAVEIVVRRPTIREPPAWHVILGQVQDPPRSYAGEAAP